VNVETDIRRQVRDFYDSVGWMHVGEGVYQNARYEDLRPVSRDYIHRCHLRLARHLPATGRFLLDAGSGPIQYPEYLEYSRGYKRRICLDLSRRALVEARKRLGAAALCVVGDVARLPFRADAFDGVVSLHTVHHLPGSEQEQAFRELQRVLRPRAKAVVVYSWGEHSALMRLMRAPIAVANAFMARTRARGRQPAVAAVPEEEAPSGTFTHKQDYRWVRTQLADLPGLDILVWRSVSTAFLRALIHRRLLGHLWLRLLFALEEGAPRWLGRIGQYPMILFDKPETAVRDRGKSPVSSRG
jgi:SAM-dependent methyltransferase